MVALVRAAHRSRLVALTLIVLTFLGTSGSWHVDDAADPDCAVQVVAHDHGHHDAQFAPPSTPSAPTHCAICHWLQTFRADAVRHARAATTPDLQIAGAVATSNHVQAGNRIALPSRAPPA